MTIRPDFLSIIFTTRTATAKASTNGGLGGLGHNATRVTSQNEFPTAFNKAKQIMDELQMPVVVEFILKHVTRVSVCMEINTVIEFQKIFEFGPAQPLVDG